MSSALASVIVPAHNEATTIEGCLRSILDDTNADSLDVVVVCNGCTDDTADLARSVDQRVRVIESPQASKAAALELGRAAATAPTRMYIDADVVVSPDAITHVAETLDDPEIHAAAPRIEMASPDATLPMRLFLDVWLRAPYFADNLIGAGFYAVSAEGDRRMGSFPAIVADDMFALTRFRTDERAVARSASFSPLVSRRLRDLIDVEVRREAARHEFDQWARRTGADVYLTADTGWVRRLATDPRRWPGLAVFVPAKLIIRFRSNRRLRSVDPQQWSRDDHARAAAGS
ncbi:MAG: glycosyltransferase [Acidimicrobiales bacterium]